MINTNKNIFGVPLKLHYNTHEEILVTKLKSLAKGTLGIVVPKRALATEDTQNICWVQSFPEAIYFKGFFASNFRCQQLI